MKADISERQVQRAILAMCGIAFPDVWITHIPNGAHMAGDRTARFKQIGALKGDGLKPGSPDLLFYWNRGHLPMEVKRPGYSPSQVSPEQRQVHATLASMGWTVPIVTSPEEAFAELKERGAPTRFRDWPKTDARPIGEIVKPIVERIARGEAA